MTLIDLGEVGFPSAAEPAPPPPPRWLRRLGVPARGKAAAVAALAVLAGGLAGTAPATGPQPRFHTMPSIDMSRMYWSTDGVVIQQARDSFGAAATDIDSGRVLWSATWSEPVTQMAAAADGSVLLQTSPDIAGPEPAGPTDAYYRRLAQGHVAALDPHTGVERWRRSGALLSPYGATDLIVLHAPPGADPAAPDGWRIAQLDLSDGHEIWQRPVTPSTRWTFTYDDDFTPVSGGLILMDSHDGSVLSVGADGRTTARGRVQPGGDLEWAWSDYLGVSRPAGAVGPTDGPPLRLFGLHDLRTLTDRPLWTLAVDPMTSSVPWPCGRPDRLCHSDGPAMAELGVRDGKFLGVQPDPLSHDPSETATALGVWTMVGGWDRGGNTLVAVSPRISKTGVGWLGAIRMRDGKPQAVPLMPVPLQLTECWFADDWLVCNGVQQDGTPWDRSLVLRRSDMEDLIRRMAGP